MAVLNEYSDTPNPSYMDDYVDDIDDNVIQDKQLPPPESESLDLVPPKEKATSKPAVSVNQIPNLRLPHPCPLPNTFSVETIKAEEQEKMVGCNKFRMLREAYSFYHGICPNPTASEYTIMAQTLCEKFPQIKDKTDCEYWVSTFLSLCKTFNFYIDKYQGLFKSEIQKQSEPTNTEKGKQKKIVTVSHAVPLGVDDQECDSDVVAYERNMKVLLSEYKKQPTNDAHIQKLLKVTHKIRREKINTSAVSAVDIQEELKMKNG